MFLLSAMFWKILGLGVSIPCTLIIIMNLGIKAISGDSYELSLKRVGILYFIALLGWAIYFGVVF